jgi:uncharacterized protein (TIGR01777 family)
MKILISGGTGLIGSAFIRRYPEHDYIVWTRDRAHATTVLGDDLRCIESLDQLAADTPLDAIINLAGAPIMAGRWSARRKRLLRESRWQTTQQLVDWMSRSTQTNRVFLSGSAVGYYGNSGMHAVTEATPVEATDFAHLLCAGWERVARMVAPTVRVVLLRTGIVLAPGGGALQRMLPAFRMGLGGRLGSGHQFMSWIHLQDMLAALQFLLARESCSGPFNLVAPNPVSNAVFAQSLASVLGGRARLPVPAPVLKWLLGEASQLLLFSQKVLPERLLQAGFQFGFPSLDGALRDLLKV